MKIRATLAALALMALPWMTPQAQAKDDLVIGVAQFPSSLHPDVDAEVVKQYVLGFVTRPITAYDKDWKNSCLLCAQLPTLENGLAKLETVDGKPGDKTGIVEFTAHFSRLGKREAHYERSSFRFDEAGQRWYFVEGGKPKGKTVVKGAQVGRNDPCTCGSGKKFKKCCGAAA